MRFFTCLTTVLAVASNLAAGAPSTGLALLQRHAAFESKTIDDFQVLANEVIAANDGKLEAHGNGCTLANARIRRDWEHLTKCERKEYIRAVKCLWQLPVKAPEFSAAQNYFDEFVAIHVNLTNFIHGTGNFLTWHRYVLHLWEETLRNDCGYKGALPYWNWFKYQDNLAASPVFDGSDTSLGGDGEFFAHNGSLVGSGQVWLPSGEGGGCVKSGPFKDFQVNIGPIAPAMDGFVPLMKNQLDYNPRCQRRDLTNAASKVFTAENLQAILSGAHSHNISAFQNEFQGQRGTLRMHGAGHYAMGGDGSDVYSSLNDPAFYQHHAMVDRVYWIWQLLHPKEANTIAGTLTFRNNPPSRDATVDDPLDMGILGEHIPIKDVLDTMGGTPLCYIYV